MNNSDGLYCHRRESAYALKAKIRKIHGGSAVNCNQISRIARTIGGYDPNNLQEQLFGPHGAIPLLLFQRMGNEDEIGKVYSF
jgi:hypothetical protein